MWVALTLLLGQARHARLDLLHEGKHLEAVAQRCVAQVAVRRGGVCGRRVAEEQSGGRWSV